MDKWKSFFQSSGSDIWTVIDRAITIAAVEHPAEMRVRRDKFTEKMFCPTAHLAGLCECEDAADAQNGNENNNGGSDEDDDVSETKFVVADARAEEEGEEEDEEDEEEEVDEDEDDRGRRKKDMELEALTDEVEEETRRIREVSRLKSRIVNADEDDVEYLLETLEGLERLNISFETLKATSVGKPVNDLRKHSSSRVRAIVKRLISGWKALTDQWSNSAKHLTSDPVSNDAQDDEFGLPSPPVDEDELLAAGSGPVEVTKLFDFIEDDMSAGSDMNEQPRRGSSGDWVNGIYEDADSPDNNVAGEKPNRKVSQAEVDRHHRHSNNSKPLSRKDTSKSSESYRSRGVDAKLEKPSSKLNGKHSNDDSRDSRKTLPASSSRLKPGAAAAGASSGAPKPIKPTTSANSLQKRGEEKLQSSKASLSKQDGSTMERLAAAKRKLHEGYRQAENAKKQRTVQVMELTDLPKGKGGPKAAKAGPTKSHVQHNNRYMNHSRR